MNMEKSRQPDRTFASRVESVPHEERKAVHRNASHRPSALPAELATKFWKRREALGKDGELLKEPADAQPLVIARQPFRLKPNIREECCAEFDASQIPRSARSFASPAPPRIRARSRTTGRFAPCRRCHA